jgi:hypothetical protein
MPVGGRDPASKRRHSAAQRSSSRQRNAPGPRHRAPRFVISTSVCVYACVCTREIVHAHAPEGVFVEYDIISSIRGSIYYMYCCSPAARRQLAAAWPRARRTELLPHSVQLTSGVPSRVFAQNTA